MTKILTIDDRRENLIAVKALLSSLIEDCEVIMAQSGYDGIEKAEDESPDVILLDVKMPEMDGYEVCRRLKSSDNTRFIPVVMLTATYPDVEKRIKGLDTGADAYLNKPIDEQELIAQIKAMIRIKRAEDELRSKNVLLAELLAERTDRLSESEKKYSHLFNSISDAVVIHDTNGFILEINKSACEAFGRGREELLKQPVTEVLGENTLKFTEAVKMSLKEADNLFYQTVMINSDGSQIPVEVNSRLIEYKGKSAVLSVARDISQYKLLEELRMRLSLLTEDSDDAIIGLTRDGVVVSWNRGAKEMYGYSNEEVIGCSYSDFLPPYYPDEVPELLDRIKRGEKVSHYETHGLHKSGSQIHMTINMSPVMDTTEKIIGASIIARDNTEYRKTQEELSKRHEFIKNLDEITPAFYVALSKVGEILEMSSSMLDVLGYRAEEVIGKNYKDTFVPVLEHEMLNEFFRSLVSEDQEIVSENSMITKDGRVLFVEWHGKPFFNHKGRFEFFFAVGIDRTERKHLEKDLMSHDEKNRQKIGQELHEGLGQYLTSVVFRSELLNLKLKSKSYQEAEEAEEITNQLYTAIDHTRKLARSLCPVDVDRGGLRAALETLTAAIQTESGITCLLNWDDNVTVEQDLEASTLYYVITESVENAIRHGNVKNIVISLSSEEKVINLNVIDDGKGTFDSPLFSDGPILRMMKYRAWIIGAMLSVKRNEAGGTIVTCALRSFEEEKDRAHNVDFISPINMGDEDKAGILIVDNHPVVRQGLVQIISRESDLSVCGEAKKTSEAIRLVADLKPDMLIIDISLDGNSGIELIKALKNHYPRIKILVFSLFDESLYAERAIRSGALGYIMQNEPAEVVIRAVRAVLGGDQYLSNSVKEKILKKMSSDYNSPKEGALVDSLTNREFEIFQLIGQGLGNRHIAEKLQLSVKTVENYRERIKSKLNLDKSSDLIRFAIQWTINL